MTQELTINATTKQIIKNAFKVNCMQTCERAYAIQTRKRLNPDCHDSDDEADYPDWFLNDNIRLDINFDDDMNFTANLVLVTPRVNLISMRKFHNKNSGRTFEAAWEHFDDLVDVIPENPLCTMCHDELSLLNGLCSFCFTYSNNIERTTFKNHKGENDVCSICHEDTPGICIELKCKHILHHNCFRAHVRNADKPKCPLCRGCVAHGSIIDY